MTAEIAVMNRLGIALAADSAVTVGPDARKIYSSAEKLFMLTPSSPVGVMVYDSGNLLGVPWETVIKVYCQRHGTEAPPTLAEYAKLFREYLANSRELFPDSAQADFVGRIASSYYGYLFGLLRKQIDLKTESSGKVSGDEIRILLAAIIQAENKRVLEPPPDVKEPRDFRAVVLDTYGSVIDTRLNVIFGNLPLEQPERSALRNVVPELLLSRKGPASGIVIAGFGDADRFPSLVHFVVRGVAANHLLCSPDRVSEITDTNLACISPFAQQEVVAAFMDGIDPYLERAIAEATKKLMQAISKTAMDQTHQEAAGTQTVSVKLQDALDQALEKTHKDFLEEIRKYQRRQFSEPIVRIVAVLPKDELAAMAEALVNLTKLKRRVSDQQETVGGPVDVALITKGDGFVWIRRKSYYDAALNVPSRATHH